MEWVAISSPGDLSDPGISLSLLHCRQTLHHQSHREAHSVCIRATGKPILCLHAQSLQSCPALRPHGLQPTRLLCPWDSPGKNTIGLECHASSRVSSRSRDQTHDSHVSCIGRQVLYHQHHLQSPKPTLVYNKFSNLYSLVIMYYVITVNYIVPF